ncbi:PTS sugar transporter subunit IIA [Cellulosilyticum sp. I15G10I2]|uniref:PTS sugar transporter subunit IIA n=1 Tax=Cellulosilyticum sp. I15G10I2 TaxID=1892843 RepID=UPI001FA6ECA1|nr:PTS glucose transporter subunit IIA [Cellulosilyticum sp. I15G10I2]
MFDFFRNYKIIDLYAPIEGTIKRIEEVPDTLFAQKMVGDGIAIEPASGIVKAPCDGKVVQIASTNHAVGIETDLGLEILIHVGIDTVELKGDGFKRIVEVGTIVNKGDILLEIDLERVKALGKPIITPVIITNTERTDITYKAEGAVKVGHTVVMKVKVKKEK